jgi:hypothetical protein
VGEELLQQLLAAPEANAEEIPCELLLHIGLKATPTHEEAGLSTKLLTSSDQLVDRGVGRSTGSEPDFTSTQICGFPKFSSLTAVPHLIISS